MNKRPYLMTWAKQESDQNFTLLKSQDVRVETLEYGQLFDLSSTSYHVSFGNNHPLINEKIIKQLQEFSTASPKSQFQLKEEATDKLIKLVNNGNSKVFYTVSGAEAIENALKMARFISNKKTIVATDIGYHGATLGALSVTGDWRNKIHLTLDEYTLRIPSCDRDPDAKQAEKIILEYGVEKIAALCLETITGGNGVYVPEQKWWDRIQKICKEHDIYLICDEVVCGFHRTGKAFAFHHYNISPDFICLSKAITGGHVPFGAVVIKEEHLKRFDEEVFSFGLTNYAHPIGLAAMMGVFDIVSASGFQKNLILNEKIIKNFLSELDSVKIVTETRQAGLLAAIDLTFTPSSKELYKYGLYIVCNEKRFILAPALNMTQEVLEESLKKLKNYILSKEEA